jgi:hypothetical protein
LAQFPSPRPLTEQEQFLRIYVRNFPQQAAIVAQDQTKTDQEMEKLLADEFSVRESDQQER